MQVFLLILFVILLAMFGLFSYFSSSKIEERKNKMKDKRSHTGFNHKKTGFKK